MTTTEAANLLKIDLPTSMNALKRQFKRKAREEHPDKSKHPRAKERFISISNAFELLSKSANNEVIEIGEDTSLTTIDGHPLVDLGNGLGPTINGIPCDNCKGRGYNSVSERIRCTDCRENAWYMHIEYKCTKCAGSGSFKRGQKIIGDCFRCKGSGWFSPRTRAFTNNCRKCKGSMYVSVEYILSYHMCMGCKGSGEIEILNPVLPKGLIA